MIMDRNDTAATGPEKAAYESVLYGWNLERKGDVVRAVCTFCRYSFARGVDDTLREFAETAAQHECRWGL